MRRTREKGQRIARFLAGNPLLVGMDLAQKKHAVWFATHKLVPLERFMVAHSRDGIEGLAQHARRRCEEQGLDRVLVFLEPTSHFWENVANVLAEQGIAYRLIAGLAVSRQREIQHLTYAKGDYRDAELIMKLGAQGNWLEVALEHDPRWRRLRAFALEHEHVLEATVAEELRVKDLLGLALPEYLEYFKDPLGNTSRALLKRLSRPPAAIPTTVEELVARSSQVTGYRFALGKVRAWCARIQSSRSFGVARALQASLARLGFAVERFEFFGEMRAELEARLREEYEKTPYSACLNSIPGVSPVSHALLLGLIGDPKRYDSGTCLVKLAGVEPRENASGQSEGSHSISRRGRGALRHLLYRIVLGLNVANAEFAAYLRHLRTREKHPLMWNQAVMAGANKYLRLVHRMCLEGKPYAASKLEGRSRLEDSDPHME